MLASAARRFLGRVLDTLESCAYGAPRCMWFPVSEALDTLLSGAGKATVEALLAEPQAGLGGLAGTPLARILDLLALAPRIPSHMGQFHLLLVAARLLRGAKRGKKRAGGGGLSLAALERALADAGLDSAVLQALRSDGNFRADLRDYIFTLAEKLHAEKVRERGAGRSHIQTHIRTHTRPRALGLPHAPPPPLPVPPRSSPSPRPASLTRTRPPSSSPPSPRSWWACGSSPWCAARTPSRARPTSTSPPRTSW